MENNIQTHKIDDCVVISRSIIEGMLDLSDTDSIRFKAIYDVLKHSTPLKPIVEHSFENGANTITSAEIARLWVDHKKKIYVQQTEIKIP